MNLGNNQCWTNEQQVLILTNLIPDSRLDNEIFAKDCVTIRRNIIKIKYGASNCDILSEAFRILQISYRTITEYYDAIYERIVIYSAYYEISKTEFNRHMSECFFSGLGRNSNFEIVKARIQDNLQEALEYLKNLDKVINKEIERYENKITNNIVDNDEPKKHFDATNTRNNYNTRKWCSIHKNNSHQTKECFYNQHPNSRPANKGSRNLEETKIITEPMTKISTIILSGKINGKDAKLILDSGATKNFIGSKLATGLGLDIKEDATVDVKFANNQTETSCNSTLVKLEVNDLMECRLVKLQVLQEGPDEVILGTEFLHGNGFILNYKLGLVEYKNRNISFHDKSKECELDNLLFEKLNLATEKELKLNKTMDLYKLNNDKFKCIKTNTLQKIVYDKSLKYYEAHPYKVPLAYVGRLKEELARLESEEIIERCNSKFASPAFVIEKKNKDLRLVIDYRHVNKYILDEIYQIPNIHDNLLLLSGNLYFSQLDLTNGFNQAPIDVESRVITGFYILGKHYQYKRIPFGIKSGPKLFQRIISELLEEIDNVFVYIDDIVIYGKSKDAHDETLLQVLKTLYNHNLRINFDKSKFCKTEIEILGCIVNNRGIRANLKNLDEKILLKEPKTKKELQRLLGIINWFRTFVPNLSTKINQVTNLLKKTDTQKIKWSSSHTMEINNIVEIIKKNINLVSPDFNKKFILQCDASDTGMGSVLIQAHGLIGCYSKKFLSSEVNYSIVEKELFAIVKSMDHFRRIIQGNYVRIETDSKNCTFENKKISNRLERWKVLLNEFNFEIFSIDGMKNNIADHLSRCYIISQGKADKQKYDEKVRSYCTYANNSMGVKDLLKDNKQRIIISENKAKEFIKFIHEISEHCGEVIMYLNIKKHYWVHNIKRNITEVCHECRKCLINKERNKKKYSNVKIYSEIIFETISTDIYGPFSLEEFEGTYYSTKGFILTITDVFSRYTKIFFNEKIRSQEVIECLEVWQEHFTKPKKVVSDNGTQYTSHLVKNYLQKQGIKQQLIPAYHPQSNGVSERINRTISEMLRMNKKKNMKSIVKSIEHRINNNVNTTIGCSPREVVFKRSFYDLESKEMEYSQPSRTEVHDTDIVTCGQEVYRKNPSTNKLEPKYCGPYKVSEVGINGRWVKLIGYNDWIHLSQLKF
ncbi:DDI1-like protein [Vairimorpha necatrix]|uniref:RNA-directed DNA polymerase n=1 Tax=Vairimorpha necatrix TaxID=6039 RepID=A0AAX4JAR0_9MICR